jgi:hypothetical protein
MVERSRPAVRVVPTNGATLVEPAIHLTETVHIQIAD